MRRRIDWAAGEHQLPRKWNSTDLIVFYGFVRPFSVAFLFSPSHQHIRMSSQRHRHQTQHSISCEALALQSATCQLPASFTVSHNGRHTPQMQPTPASKQQQRSCDARQWQESWRTCTNTRWWPPAMAIPACQRCANSQLRIVSLVGQHMEKQPLRSSNVCVGSDVLVGHVDLETQTFARGGAQGAQQALHVWS